MKMQNNPYDKQVNGKKLIVNGSVNSQLTREEFLMFHTEKELFISGCWNLIVEMDLRSPEKIEGLPKHNEIQDAVNAGADSALDIGGHIFDMHFNYKFKVKETRHKEELEQGRVLAQAFKTVRPEFGEISLTTSQLIGFIEAEGLRSFNGFSVEKLKEAALNIENLEIKLDYGLNNPNTGRNCLYWNICLSNLDAIECWFTSRTGITEATFKTIKNSKVTIETILKSTNPDSLREYVNYWPEDTPQGKEKRIYSTKFTLWWD